MLVQRQSLLAIKEGYKLLIIVTRLRTNGQLSIFNFEYVC